MTCLQLKDLGGGGVSEKTDMVTTGGIQEQQHLN